MIEMTLTFAWSSLILQSSNTHSSNTTTGSYKSCSPLNDIPLNEASRSVP